MSEGVRIGALAELTGVSTRSLRYYEEQGLLKPSRGVNGYRIYGPEQVETARHIRQLLDTGLGTEAVRGLLPCWSDTLERGACPDLLARLDEHLAEADRQIACRQRTRDLLATLREQVRARAAA